MGRTKFLTGVLVAVWAFGPSVAHAQTLDDLLLPMPVALRPLGGAGGRATPGVAAGSPLGFGPNIGDVFAGFGYQAESRYGNRSDGAASVGVGLGDSRKAVGVELVYTSLSTVRSGFFDRSTMSAKVHRALPGAASIGVGVEGIIVTGGNSDSPMSYYAAASKVVALRGGGDAAVPFSSVTLNAGVGNGRFCRETKGTLPSCSASPFASVGLRVASKVGMVADWTGQDLTMGVSIAPFSRLPLVISPSIVDLTGRAGDRPRFTLGAGFGIRL